MGQLGRDDGELYHLFFLKAPRALGNPARRHTAARVGHDWYGTLAGAPGRSCTWRDPFVFADPDGAGWHMLITARAGGVPRLRSGVLAHARSADMLAWGLQPPLQPL